MVKNSANSPLISVVLPIYNVESYLKRCLDSVCMQTYTNLDIILVDDGSPDNCGLICDSYAEKDNRIRVIHKQNGGLSDARNAGIDIAKGEYITFIDSDDYVDKTYIEYLVYLIQKFRTRIAISTHQVVYDTGKVIRCNSGEEYVLTDRDCMERILYHDTLDISAWGKLYCLALFQQVRYPKGKLFEDAGTTYKLILQCDQIACGIKDNYYYMVRSNSIVTSSFCPQKLDMIEVTDQMAEAVLKKYPDLLPAVQRRQVYARFTTLCQMLDCPKEYQKTEDELISYIKAHAKSQLTNPRVPRRDKAAFFACCCGKKTFQIAWRLYCRITNRKGAS